MTDFKEKIFINPQNLIEDDAEIVFVSDMFVEDYVGGAELTSEALIETSPFKIQKLHSRKVNLGTLSQGKSKFWIFGNFSQINPELIPSIVANLKYTVLEYDYKYCSYRSPEKHVEATGCCDCHNKINGKVISAFYYGAQALWWMSEKQKKKYFDLFPFLTEKTNIVLSSVFSKSTLSYIKHLSQINATAVKNSWLVLGSESWVKGASAAKKWCEDNQKLHDVVWNLPYNELLERLSKSKGFVYLPAGADTCPRMVIEAKLLGCELHLNDFVQHKDEEWFNTEDLNVIYEYLSSTPTLFWNTVKKLIDYNPTISGYTTTYNCINNQYPFEKCIKSMTQFCTEVIVLDAGSNDGTWEKLEELAKVDSKIKLHKHIVDFSQDDFAYESDGMQKARARKLCSSDFCWQMDSDEIVHEKDSNKIIELCKNMPKGIEIVSLPVVEYWGGPAKVRCDIQPWKWRLSRNLPHITHGIPKELRRYDQQGKLYPAEGTDGCEMIHAETGDRLNHITFHTHETEKIRLQALSGDLVSLKKYQDWFNDVIKNIPGVYHYSWYDMPRKMRFYRDYWTKFWQSLYKKPLIDTSETNMMFDVPWSEVTEEMIIARSEEICKKTGGWIWHSKWTGQETPHIVIDVEEPSI